MKLGRDLPLVGMALATALAAVPSAVAQSTETPSAETGAWDPLEELNRATFAFNGAIATALAPVVVAYRETVPDTVKVGLDNVFTNLREPLTALSSGLQGDFDNAGASVGRFAVNLVAGIGGVLDVATPMGLTSRPEDLGSALCSYGIGAGPYIVLPLVGPSTGREAAGLVAMYSLGYEIAGDEAVAYYVGDGAIARLSDMDVSSETAPADAYVAQRDAYLELRDEICSDGPPADQIKASPLGGIIRKSG
jgi:phospholipid-binding lipoprotein MlaA